jgi:hypothetical protein
MASQARSAPGADGRSLIADRRQTPISDRRSPICRRGQAGYALLAVLIMMAALTPLAAFALMQARLDALVQDSTRRALEAFHIAESGLEHALADLAADPRFERLGLGPDGRPGTGDDADYPFKQAPPPFFPRPPYRYEVRVVANGADRADLVAFGYGAGTAVHALGATVVRDARPYVAAALAATPRVVELALGRDFRVTGDPAPSGPAALAVGDEDTAADLRARLGPDAGGRLIGGGGAPSIAAATLPDLAALLGSALGRADARLVGGQLQGALGHGLFVSPGSLRLADVSGDGVLVAGGALEIGGATTFSGLIIALGDIRIDASSTTTVAGAVMAGGALLLRGAGEIRYDRNVIERLGSEFGALLPHGIRVVGWREWPEAAPS